MSKALNIQLVEHCQVVAGDRGLSRIIRTASIMDTPDLTMLKKGDFLLTTGFVFKDSPEMQRKLIQEMDKRECSGLAIKVKRFLSSTPEAMLKEANRLNFPLLEIPYDLALSDLLICITREIFNSDNFFNDQQRKKEFFTQLLEGEYSNRDDMLKQLQDFGLFFKNCYNIMYCVVNKHDHSSTFNTNAFYQLVSDIEVKCNLKMVVVKLDHYIIIAQPPKNIDPPILRLFVKQAAALLVKHFEDLFPGKTITIGIGKIKQDIVDIYSSYKEAKDVIQLGLHKKSEGSSEIYDYAEMEPEILLQQLPELTLTSYLTSTLDPLIRYDQENDTNLLRTLEVFLMYRGKIEDTARSLFLHRNTVKFRINRVEEILNIDLRDGEEWFRLQLGLKVARLLVKS